METSRQYSFINDENGFTISLIDGHELIKTLAKIHNIGPNALDYYRKTVLSSLQMINFIKPTESLGFYIDSEDPFYRFKIEMSNSGTLRTLLLPEEFEDLPHQLTGKCRITKIMQDTNPYTSILDFTDHPVENLVNEVMEKSYQTNSKIITDKTYSTSLMLTKLPSSNIDKKIETFEDISLDKIEQKYHQIIQAALLLPAHSIEDYVQLFNTAGFSYLGSKEVKFHCPCSKERMIDNIFTLRKEDREDLFSDRSVIETRCDYCNSVYDIQKNEIIKNLH
ncbi:MAG: Hsp33 family molecular chaperone HslO [Halobacteriovoraceae bacterium]|nr:Hsp33 family molecular chaperone HslO [Halobacteriovoraceae bacterium]